jgi:hypothetical protein
MITKHQTLKKRYVKLTQSSSVKFEVSLKFNIVVFWVCQLLCQPTKLQDVITQMTAVSHNL